MTRKTLALAVAVTCVFCTHLALADETSYTEKKTGSGTDVTFVDTDVLSADQFGGPGAVLRVAPAPKRILLLRPRTQFVTEMLKSVEEL